MGVCKAQSRPGITLTARAASKAEPDMDPSAIRRVVKTEHRVGAMKKAVRFVVISVTVIAVWFVLISVTVIAVWFVLISVTVITVPRIITLVPVNAMVPVTTMVPVEMFVLLLVT
jgi:hypothetical protein